MRAAHHESEERRYRALPETSAAKDRAALSHAVAAKLWRDVADIERRGRLYGGDEKKRAATLRRATKKAEQASEAATAADAAYAEHRAVIDRIKAKHARLSGARENPRRARENPRGARGNPIHIRKNHHIRTGGTFYTPGGRRGTVLAPASKGSYPVRWKDGTLGRVRDTEQDAYPTAGSRANPKGSSGKPALKYHPGDTLWDKFKNRTVGVVSGRVWWDQEPGEADGAWVKEYTVRDHLGNTEKVEERRLHDSVRKRKNPEGRTTDAQAKLRGFAFGNTFLFAEKDDDHQEQFRVEDAFNAWRAGLPPRQQKIADKAFSAARWRETKGRDGSWRTS